MRNFFGNIRWWLWEHLPNRYCWAVEHEYGQGYTIFFAVTVRQAERIGRSREGLLPEESVFVASRSWWLGED